MVKKKYRSLSGKVYNSRAEALNDNKRYYKDIDYRLESKANILKSKKVDYYKDYTPFIKDKAVTLSGAGRATGAVLSTNLLDSIAKYSEITGLPLTTAIGLAAKESTLGNPTHDFRKFGAKSLTQGINSGLDVATPTIVSYWKYAEEDPYTRLIKSVNDRISSNKIPASDRNKYLRWEEKSADKQAASYEKYNTGPILKAAFNYYKDYPQRYNPGQGNYVDMVNTVGNEVWQSPEVKLWNRRRLESAGKKSK